MLGVKEEYEMERSNFKGRKIVMIMFMMKLMVKKIKFGIKLEKVIYKEGKGGKLWGVVIEKIVKKVKLVIIVMIKLIEKVDKKVEDEERVFGEKKLKMFRYVLLKMMMKGILDELMIVMVSKVEMLEMKLINEGKKRKKIVVEIYY